MLIETFSQRQARARGDSHDVFVYDSMPQKLRIQIVQIFMDQLGDKREFAEQRAVRGLYMQIFKIICREQGTFRLAGNKYDTEQDQFLKFIQEENSVELVLDAVEIACKCINAFTRNFDYRRDKDAGASADRAIEELNARFAQSAVGYRFEGNQIIRIDAEFTHSEVVVPALTLLHSQSYKGAESEFHAAHAHYRKGNYSEALVECLKSLESVCKTIADRRKWVYQKSATASTLIKLMFDNGIVPPFWETHFSALRTTLESGVPTARNKRGGHGQGAEVAPPLPPHVVAFVIHQTAAAIVFFAEADKQFAA